MKTWALISMVVITTAGAFPVAGVAAVSVKQQSYFFEMDVTRNIAALTFVIGDFGPVRSLRPSAQAAEAENIRSAPVTEASASGTLPTPAGRLNRRIKAISEQRSTTTP